VLHSFSMSWSENILFVVGKFLIPLSNEFAITSWPSPWIFDFNIPLVSFFHLLSRVKTICGIIDPFREWPYNYFYSKIFKTIGNIPVTSCIIAHKNLPDNGYNRLPFTLIDFYWHKVGSYSGQDFTESAWTLFNASFKGDWSHRGRDGPIHPYWSRKVLFPCVFSLI